MKIIDQCWLIFCELNAGSGNKIAARSCPAAFDSAREYGVFIVTLWHPEPD
jgi:hypothetical protein